MTGNAAAFAQPLSFPVKESGCAQARNGVTLGLSRIVLPLGSICLLNIKKKL